MNALIHTVAGPEVGYGHVVRCSHLANELRRRGVTVYAWPYRPTIASGYLRDHGGASVRGSERADIGILDTMTYDSQVVEELRERVDKLVVIVGAGQNLTPAVARMTDLLVYQTGWVVDERPTVSGPDFIILDPQYAVPLDVVRRPEALVVFGAGIPWDYTVETVEALSTAGIRGTLVVPPYHFDDYEFTVPPPGFGMLRSPVTLRGLQATHVVQVGSLGMSTYEALCAGCWPITVGRTADHLETADTLMTMGMGWSMGDWERAEPADIASTAATYLATGPIESPRCIDGKGVTRVADRILEGR